MNYTDIKTPAYCYDLTELKRNLSHAQSAAKKYGYYIHYALKANFNKRVLDIIKQYNFGADCVSGGEINLAISSGFSSNTIFFAGVGKTDEEIDLAFGLGILAFNVESLHELNVIGARAHAINKTAQIALRINPNIDAKTHQHITTGRAENKFGIFTHEISNCLEVFQKNRHLEFVGLHFHIGSQITDLNIFHQLCLKVNEWNEWFTVHGYKPKILNLGGGLGVNYVGDLSSYQVNFEDFFSIFNQHLIIQEDQKVHFELGRSLVASCGSLLTKVLYIKNGLQKNFAIVDAGMTELLRPALYQTFHPIEALHKFSPKLVSYDVVGPICESSDCFGKDVLLPSLERGDLLAIRFTGAYGEVMASRYNLRNKHHCYFID